EKSLKPYIDAAAQVRAVGRARRSKLNGSANGNGKSSPEQLSAIRDWARKNGHEVADRGRIKAEVVEAFDAAH
ncbi:MAG: Lsr2 family DNA-binding protein, partial [Mycobacterium sp.]